MTDDWDERKEARKAELKAEIAKVMAEQGIDQIRATAIVVAQMNRGMIDPEIYTYLKWSREK